MTGIVLGGLALVVFGLSFNHFVAWLQRRHIGDFTAWQVVIGVLVVLAVLVVAAPAQLYTKDTWAALALGYFVCAGGPMAWGSWRRRRR